MPCDDGAALLRAGAVPPVDATATIFPVPACEVADWEPSVDVIEEESEADGEPVPEGAVPEGAIPEGVVAEVVVPEDPVPISTPVPVELGGDDELGVSEELGGLEELGGFEELGVSDEDVVESDEGVLDVAGSSDTTVVEVDNRPDTSGRSAVTAAVARAVLPRASTEAVTATTTSAFDVAV